MHMKANTAKELRAVIIIISRNNVFIELSCEKKEKYGVKNTDTCKSKKENKTGPS